MVNRSLCVTCAGRPTDRTFGLTTRVSDPTTSGLWFQRPTVRGGVRIGQIASATSPRERAPERTIRATQPD